MPRSRTRLALRQRPRSAAGAALRAAALCAALAWGPGCAPLLAQRNAVWHEARVGSLRVVSDLGASRTGLIAERLAVFERLLRRISNTRSLDAELPTLVLALSPAAYAQYEDPRRAVGRFVPTPRGNVVLAREGGPDQKLEAVLYHEYGHFSLESDPAFGYPAWYHEGHAEMLATARIDADSVRFGAPLPRRVETLLQFGLMPSERLFSLRSAGGLSPGETQVFYAQAWLSVLYLTYGGAQAARIGLPDRSGQLQQYLALTNEGRAPAQAAERAFGADFATLDRELQLFLKRGSSPEQRLSRRAFGALDPPAVQELGPAQQAEALGWAALALGDAQRAEREYGRALAQGPERPELLGALALARSRLEQGPGTEAAELCERALAAAPTAPSVQLDCGELLLTRAAALPGQSAALLQRASALLEAAAASASAPAEAHRLLALARERAGEPPERVLAALARAQALRPSEPRLALELARRLTALGQLEEARRIALRALAGLHDPRQAQALEALLDRLEHSAPGAAARGAARAPAFHGSPLL